MKPFLPTILLLTSSWSNLTGQIDFAAKLYSTLVFDAIVVKNAQNEAFTPETWRQLFYQTDTAVNCFGDYIDVFSDNVYVDPQFIVLTRETEFDTLTNPRRPAWVDVFKINRDDVGDYKNKTFAFSFKRTWLDADTTATRSVRRDKRLSNKPGEYWKIKNIQRGNQPIFLDDCHQQYRLQLTAKHGFTQCYPNGATTCTAVVDSSALATLHQMPYWGKEILHETSIGNGQWKTLHNRLLLMSHDRKTLKNIPYQYKNDTLVLLYEHDYTITLERTRAHKK